MNTPGTSGQERVASMLHGVPGSGWKSPEFCGFRWDGLATRFDKERPRYSGAKSLTFLEKELVAGAGFEPATFRL